MIAGDVGNDNRESSHGRQALSLTIKQIAAVAKAGGLCHLEAETLSWLARRAVRLVAGDSSVSFRMAQRSSVAETTGKRMTSIHTKARMHCRAVNLRPTMVDFEPRHNQKAGSASSSHARFSSSSMEKMRGVNSLIEFFRKIKFKSM
ncbi:MAG TPA: hypothetical protein VH196_01360 [Terriglobales bacterium]|nr:hypothetical protein [Terriglobales bacterium]